MVGTIGGGLAILRVRYATGVAAGVGGAIGKGAGARTGAGIRLWYFRLGGGGIDCCFLRAFATVDPLLLSQLERNVQCLPPISNVFSSSNASSLALSAVRRALRSLHTLRSVSVLSSPHGNISK